MSEKKTGTVEKAGSKAAVKSAVKATVSRTASKAAVKSAVKAAVSRAKTVEFIIQSPLGGEITPEEVLKKVGKADKIYIRVDQNKAYWVRGEESGSVELW